jgi:hypothetical protein
VKKHCASLPNRRTCVLRSKHSKTGLKRRGLFAVIENGINVKKFLGGPSKKFEVHYQKSIAEMETTAGVRVRALARGIFLGAEYPPSLKQCRGRNLVGREM